MTNSLNSFLNFVVLAAICVGGYFFLTAPKDYGPPPNDAFFRAAVIDRPGPVLVKFGAPWCGPCRAMETSLDQFEASEGGAVSVVRIDVDQHPNLSQHYGVSGIPHAFLFENGKVVSDRVGYMDAQQLKSWVASKAN